MNLLREKIENGKMCRRCINQKTHINLKRKDCVYMMYPYKCLSCGAISNIVCGVRWQSRYKILFAHMDS